MGRSPDEDVSKAGRAQSRILERLFLTTESSSFSEHLSLAQVPLQLLDGGSVVIKGFEDFNSKFIFLGTEEVSLGKSPVSGQSEGPAFFQV